MDAYNEFLQILEQFRNIFSANPHIFRKEPEIKAFIFNELFNKYKTNLVEIDLSGDTNNVTSKKILSKNKTSIVHLEAEFETTFPIDIAIFNQDHHIKIVKNEIDNSPNATFGKYSDKNILDFAIEVKHLHSNRRKSDDIKHDYEKLNNTKLEIHHKIIIIVDNFDNSKIEKRIDFENWIEKIKKLGYDSIEFIYLNTKNSDIWIYK